MARTSDPQSATAQFFIKVSDNALLNQKPPSGQGWGYAVFGEDVDGMEVVNAIKGGATGNKGPYQDVPKENVGIEKASIVD